MSLPEPSDKTCRDWNLSAGKINRFQDASIERLVAISKQAHMVNAKVRIAGEWREYEADWIQHLIPSSPSAIGASAEKAMDRIVENSREQIDEAARNMGKAASIGLGVGPIPAPVSHGGDTPRTDALISSQDQRSAVYFPLRLDEMTELARQLERENAGLLAAGRTAVGMIRDRAAVSATVSTTDEREAQAAQYLIQWAMGMLAAVHELPDDRKVRIVSDGLDRMAAEMKKVGFRPGMGKTERTAKS